MTTKRYAPGTRSEHAGAMITGRNKDNHFCLSRSQKRIFDLLSDGFPRSVADISTELRLSDPRGIIRDLRGMGVKVSDYWVNGEHGRRFKRYFIRREAGNE